MSCATPSVRWEDQQSRLTQPADPGQVCLSKAQLSRERELVKTLTEQLTACRANGRC
jgi:hypothetical protein